VSSDLDELLVPADVVERRTPAGAIVGIVVAAGLVLGGLVAGATAATVAISHTELGLCGDLGVPCTSLSLDRVRSLSGLALPDGATVTRAYYNRTAEAETFASTVVLPRGARDPLIGSLYQSYPYAPVPTAETKRLTSLAYSAEIDGNDIHYALSGIDGAGRQELILNFDAGR
jgi:hypothetical protein